MYNNICRKKNFLLHHSQKKREREREREEHKQSNFKNTNSKTSLKIVTSY